MRKLFNYLFNKNNKDYTDVDQVLFNNTQAIINKALKI